MRDLLIHLYGAERGSLQVRLRRAIVSAILEGELDSGEPLPSCRKMAQTLGIARNTVVRAYQALVDDGFLVARERSGYYVNGEVVAGRAAGDGPAAAPAGTEVDWIARLQIRPSTRPNIVKPTDWQHYPYPFVYGQLDPKMFPIAAWRECSRQALSAASTGEWTIDSFDNDDRLLISQIRRHVLPRRGVQVANDQILVTLGAQHGLYLLARLLVGPRTTVGVEDPGYVDARNIFRLQSGKLRPLTVDRHGLVLGARLDGCDYVYVTPSHQSPTTVTMPLERRLALLERAVRADFLLIEDDYESETNYLGDPTPALKSLDRHGRVLYVGSLSKTLAPGLRLGYLVGPRDLIAEARVLRRLMLRHPPMNNQRTTALFIAEGYHDSLVRKLHKVYARRWEIMGGALNRYFPHAARAPIFGGTSYWIEGPDWLDSERLAAAALDAGIIIEPGGVHFMTRPAPRNSFRLGFGVIAEERIEAGVRTLAALAGAQQPAAPISKTAVPRG